jgi:hypothetical protein
MASPLTKKNAQGNPYTRPSAVEAQIDEVTGLSLPKLKERLDITNPEQEGFLRPETLVHFLRRGIATNSMEMFNAVLPVLLKRCEKTLEAKIFNSLSAVAELREDILGQFAELLASDGRGEIPDELDYYECRFNLAFRTFWIDCVRKVGHSGQLAAAESEEELDELLVDEESVRRVSDSLHNDTPETRLRLQQLLEAIEMLPKAERDAVVLVHIMGFKEESNDPDEETAAKKCNCTGRTIRNRLASAVAKLARFQEDQ